MSRFAWPFPKELPPLDLLVLVQRWKSVLSDNGLGTQSSQFDANIVDDLGKIFLELVLLTVRGKPSRATGEKPWDWPEIAKQVVDLSEISGVLAPREEAGKVWAFRRAGLLSAPESGLSWEGAEKWLAALRAEVKTRLGEARWREFQDALREERRNRAEIVVKERGVADFKTETLLNDINTMCKGHAWVAEMHPTGPAPAKGTFSLAATASEPRKEEKSPLQDFKAMLPPLEGFAVSKSINDKLARLPPEQLEALTTTLASFKVPNARGGESKALAALWAKAVELRKNPSLAPLVKAADGDLEIGMVPLRSVPVGAENHALRLRPRRGADVVVWPMEEPKLFGQDDEGIALGGLYQLIWDFAAHRWPQRIHPILPVDWPGVSVLRNDVRVGWPSFPWLRFAQLEQVHTEWNDVVSRVSSRMDTFSDQEKVDALAYWIASTLPQRDKPDLVTPRPIQLDPTVDHWRQVVFEAHAMRTPASMTLLLTWLEHLRLFAAPECAVSATAAEGILSGLEQVQPALLRDPKKMRDLRRWNLDVEPKRREALLRKIDAATPDDHPFLKRFPPVKS